LGAALSFIIFSGVYTSVPGVKGVLYGVLMQLSIAMTVYSIIRGCIALKCNVFIKNNDTAETEGD
jgi:hypothetical protein